MKNIFQYIASLWKKIINFFKKKKIMENLIDAKTYELIRTCLEKGGTLQILPKNGTQWHDVINIDLYGNSFHIVLGGKTLAIRFCDIQSFNCSL